jgi:hypothetical protein
LKFVKSKWLPYIAKKIQILHGAILDSYEQLYKLCRLQILNRTYVTNLGTDSIFEPSMNFKGSILLGKKSDKFSKIPARLHLHKSEFSWAHLYARKSSFTQLPKGDGLNKRKSLNLKFKPYNISNTNQTCTDFIQASEIHSELLFKTL